MCDIDKLKLHLKKCQNQRIALFIMWKGKQIVGLCEKCWNKIADSYLEWGEGARTQKEVKQEIESIRYKNPSNEPEISDTKFKKILKNYEPFGKHGLIRKDIAAKLKKKE